MAAVSVAEAFAFGADVLLPGSENARRHKSVKRSAATPGCPSPSSRQCPSRVVSTCAVGSFSNSRRPPRSNLSTLHVPRVASADAATLLETGGGGSAGGGSDNPGGGGGGDRGDGDAGDGAHDKGSNGPFGGILDIILKGWRERVEADPQFVFKVVTEQVIGVTACVLGDMASRPNFGLNELDFVFSTLVVGSILNFLLMYLLAPVSSASSSALPGIFSSSPDGHMFQPGSFTLVQRAGTFVYKGIQFGAVGFLAGLAGTLVSNTLLEIRKQLQPEFKAQNEAPPTILNAATWGLHLGISSNFRYQVLNGLDLFLARALSPTVFRYVVFGIRGANNVVGGATFAMLAKVTGAQKSSAAPKEAEAEPKGVIAEPTGVKAEPKGVMAEPTGVEAEPEGVTAEPKGVEAEPKGVIAVPKGVEAEPKGVIAVLKEVNAEQKEVEAEPALSVAPEPTTSAESVLELKEELPAQSPSQEAPSGAATASPSGAAASDPKSSLEKESEA